MPANLTEFRDSSGVDLADKWVSATDAQSVAGYLTSSAFDVYNVGAGLWAWGRNYNGALGLGNTTDISSPIQVGTLTNWRQVDCGFSSTMAIKVDGTLWSWGHNSGGELGLNDTSLRNSPVQVGNLTNWKQISFGSGNSYGHAVAIKTDGTLWSWGSNPNGELGLGNTTFRSSPVQVGSLTDWSYVGAGVYNALAIKTNGTLWAWGYNTRGQLGLNDTSPRSSPVQVGTLTDWSYVTSSSIEGATAAIKTDGTLWTWGSNAYGQLGLGDMTHRSSPVQVGSLTNWKTVQCFGTGAMVAIKVDGTLWTWGSNSSYGALGLGTSSGMTSSPTQVGALTNWSKLSSKSGSASNLVLAIKTDGTLWGWGENTYGALGLGNTSAVYSPVQIGSLNTWKQVANGYYNYTLAIK